MLRPRRQWPSTSRRCNGLNLNPKWVVVQFEIRRLVQFEIRRRRWLTSAQRWSASDNPGFARQPELNPVRVRQSPTLSGFTVYFECTQGCRWRSNAGLKLANAFGVFKLNQSAYFKLHHYPLRVQIQSVAASAGRRPLSARIKSEPEVGSGAV